MHYSTFVYVNSMSVHHLKRISVYVQVLQYQHCVGKTNNCTYKEKRFTVNVVCCTCRMKKIVSDVSTKFHRISRICNP